MKYLKLKEKYLDSNKTKLNINDILKKIIHMVFVAYDILKKIIRIMYEINDSFSNIRAIIEIIKTICFLIFTR